MHELVAHRQRAEQRAGSAGLTLTRDAFMFSHTPNGQTPWWPDSTSRAFRHLRDQVGLTHVRLHDLRHYVATRLLTSRIDLRTVSGRLGHSKASTTPNVYAAFLPDADLRAAHTMARLLPTSYHRPHPDPVITDSVDTVLGLGQVRRQLPDIATACAHNGIHEPPVVFGQDGQPQAVIVSWALWRNTAALVQLEPDDRAHAETDLSDSSEGDGDRA